MATQVNRVAAFFCGCMFAGVALAGTSNASAVSAGLNAAMPAKLFVSETFAKTGQWAHSNASAGFQPSPGTPASVNVSSGGLITVTFNSPSDLAGKSIGLTPSDGGKGQVNWACKASAGFPASTLPKECE